MNQDSVLTIPTCTFEKKLLAISKYHVFINQYIVAKISLWVLYHGAYCEDDSQLHV